MTGARDVRLLAAPDLRGARLTLIDRLETLDAAAVVLVPTRHAALELRRTLLAAGVADARIPLLLTRAEWYAELQSRMHPAPPRLLAPLEREVIGWRASEETVAAGISPPFVVRPGLVGDMLSLYDGVRRHRRSVDDFERVLVAALEPGADIDRGAARLLEQTRFLAGVFRAYERALDRSAAADEHRLRDLVSGHTFSTPVGHVIVTMTDDAAGAGGLWPADFDLLTRLPGLAAIDVIATARDLDAGYRERLMELLPGIEEHRPMSPPVGGPVLLVPDGPAPALFHVHRDREEELVAIARRVRDAADLSRGPAASARTGADDVLVVYQRPLPYVYLARRVFGDVGVPFTTADTLPLAAEPYVAAVDLVFEAVLSGRARDSMLRLLESPMLTWRPRGRVLAVEDLQALRQWWDVRPGSGPDGPGIHARPSPRRSRRAARLRRARAAAAAAAADLEPFEHDRRRSDHLRALVALLAARAPASKADERAARARSAVASLLEELAAAFERHGDGSTSFREMVPVVRRTLEQHTFAPIAGSGGVRLCDARTARYASASVVWVVGVNEGEWPQPSRRSVFYPAGLLRDLGFPPDQVRQAHARAEFRDLLGVASQAAAISVFQLEEDAIVRPSVLLEDVDEIDLPREVVPAARAAPAGTGALLRAGATTIAGLDAAAGGWLAWRLAHVPPDDPRRHGMAGAPPARVLSVTQVERYLDCPFKFFSSVVLGLDEEEDHAGSGLDPRQRGTLIHRVFQSFFERWAGGGRGAVTPALLPAARALLAEIAAEELAGLPDADRVVEGMRLLGSTAAPGLGERVFRLEALAPEPVVERLLEFDLRGTYRFGSDQPTSVDLKGIADRIDLLANGTLRVIDYKSGRAPDTHRSIQLAVYALCAEQKLEGYRGRQWRVAEAAYLALGDPRPWVPVVRSVDDRAGMDEARERLLEALQGIAAGTFPPAPANRRLCRTCAFAAVCRKDYVGDVA